MIELFVLLLAFLASSAGSVLGVGGGFVFVPVSTNFLSIPHNTAVPTSLSMVLSNSVSATWTRASKNMLKPKSNFWLAIVAVPAAVLGSYVGMILDAGVFKQLFGFFLLTSAFLVKIVGQSRRGNHIQQPEAFKVGSTVLAAGFLSALLGVGGGIIMTPMFMIWGRMGPHESVGLSQFVTMFNAAAGITSYISLGFFEPVYFLAAALAGFVGGMVGSRIEIALPDKQLRNIIVTGFSLIGIWMISSGFLH